MNSSFRKKIPLHRSIRHISTPGERVWQILLLPLSTLFLLWVSWDIVGLYWIRVIEFCLHKLEIDAEVSMAPYAVTGMNFVLPHFQSVAVAPLHTQWQGMLALTSVLLIMSFIQSDRLLPLKYYLRIIAFVQTTALLVLYFSPERIPTNIAHHTESIMMFSLALMFIVPWIYGLTYNIFDIKLRYKIALTSMTLLYLAVFTPFFLVLHLYLLLNVSILFMPALYFLFGIIVPVMACIAFYGWAMSWR